MGSLRVWRALLRVRVQSVPVPSRCIMTSPTAAEKAMEKLKSNPFFDKYFQKISLVQQMTPEKLLACLSEEKAAASPKSGEHECATAASTTAKLDISAAYSKPKNLSDVMKTELLMDKTAKEIEQIWCKYYMDKEGLAASIPASTYTAIFDRSKKYPLFLLPLPRCNGYEFIVCQIAGHEVHFTQLINYQTHKENAPECLTLHHYTELADTKQMVLMRGEFDNNVLDAREAQCLVNQFQLYYGQPDERRFGILERFTHSPADFKHMDLVAELECLSL